MQGSGRNLMRAAVCAATIVLLFGISSCEQFTANIEEDFSYWASEPVITGFRAASDVPTNAAGVHCVPSASDAVLTLTVRNPKNFTFIMPGTGAPSDIVTFGSGIHDAAGTNPPEAGVDYTLVKSDRDTLTLTYKSAFLKRYEHGSDNIGAAITLYSTDGRKFNQIYKFNLDANTQPPKPAAVLAQTNSASPTYVLCLEVPDMGVSVTGGKLHKDIAQIEINGTSYPLTVSGGDFVKPSDAHFITAVTQLAGYPVPPSGNWVLYYDTQLPVGNAYQPYTVKLKDNKGLVSETLETGTARPQLHAETVNITRGQQGAGSGSGTSVGSPVIINGETSAPEAQITIQNIAGTTVHCTVQEVVGGSATGAVSPYDGNPVNVPLGLGTANEKLYEVKYHTDGTGYTASAVTTKYYKVLKCHSVTFDANGGTFTDGSTTSTSRTVLVPHNTQAAAPSGSNKPTRAGYTLGGSWYKDQACTAGQEWNFATTPVTSNITLYAKWTPNSGTQYRVEHYQELRAAAGQYPSSPTEIETPTGTTGDPISVTPKTYTGFEFDRQDPPSATIAGDGSTVVKVYYKRKTVNVTFNPDGGTISGSTSNVMLSGRFGTPLTVPANPVKTGYTFRSWNPPLSLPPVFPANDTEFMAQWHKNPKVKFKVYNGTGGSLKGTYGSSTQTAGTAIPEPSFTVTYGGSISFEARPDLAWEVDSWTVSPGSFSSGGGTGSITAALSNITQDTEVIVKFKKTTTIKSTDPQPWKLLKEVVRIADDNAVITINGEIKATNVGSNSGQIIIEKNITIQGSNNTTDILNANSGGTDAPSTTHRIFMVQSGKTLTLKNLTLKGGQNTTGAFGGAINVTVSGSKAQLENCIIEDCQANKGGAIGCGLGTAVNLTNTIIKNCKGLTPNNAAGIGGAIYASGATVTLTGCTLTGNEAVLKGGAIYAVKADVSPNTPSAVTISGGTIGGTDTNDANKATGTGTDNGMGGAIYIGDTCSLNLKDSTDPSSGVQRLRIIGNRAQKGTGIYAKNTIVSMKDTLQIDTNNDVYLDDGTKIRADNDLNPPGGITARITVPDNKYNTSTQVLIAGTGVDLASQASKFSVTPKGSEYWVVKSNGYLSNTTTDIFATISNDLIKAFESNLETTMIYQYNNLKGRLIFYKTNNGNYGVMLIVDTPSIGTGGYNLEFKYKTYSKHDGTILKNGDTTVNGTYSFDLDTGTQSTSTAPLNDTKDFYLYGSIYIDPQNGAKFYVLP
ncbi:InlB B-repeat-containing protein [Treponema socranskii]|uniref:InlB B-repeat-containing protein n=1 Tax=Treponema socranskii TaxID=53419 RepID=UPI003D6F3C52